MKKLYLLLITILLFLLLTGCGEESNTITDESMTDKTEKEILIDDNSALEESSKELALNEIPIELNEEQLSKNDDLFKQYKEVEKEPIWEFKTLDQVGDWDIEKPGVSPFGDQANYIESEYTSYPRYGSSLSYVDKDQVYKERKVYGPIWELVYDAGEDMNNEDVEQVSYDYIRYIETIGGEYMGTYHDTYTFYIEDDGYWWITMSAYNSEITINIMKEERIEINEEFIINPSDYGGAREITFSTIIPEGKFISFISSIDKGFSAVELVLETEYGDYSRRTKIRTRMDDNEGLVFVDDDYVYEPGLAYITIEWSLGDDQPTEISLLFEAKYDIETINYGEQLGGIKLTSDLIKSIEITPTLRDDIFISHEEYEESSLYFDKTQENDYIAFLPAGYYEIKLKTTEGIVDEFKTLKVPVNSGSLTEVTIPQSVTDGFKNLSAFNEEGIFISDIVENPSDSINGDTASFVFSLIDSNTKDVIPDPLNSEIYEGGIICDIVSLEPIPTPPSVVLLLDSSGSMKGQMDQTIAAAKTFISGLPANTKINIIDFDTVLKPLESNNVDSLLLEMDSLVAEGDTALFESVIEGLDILSGEERPTLVVFTDGENDNPYGKNVLLDETLSKIDERDIPIYTIGFGEGHDSSVLEVFAEESLGKYYSATDQDALEKVFKSINDKLGNTYLATYKRPLESSVSDIPVVSFVIDVSGSMYSQFRDYCDYRLDDVKCVYHYFIEELPNDTQIMVTSFNDVINVQQGITTDKVLALNAIGNLHSGGGTDILGSVLYGYEALTRVASSKKILIYLTDAALDVEPEDDEKFQELLAKIARDDIQVLWVGMGLEDETPFMEAAEKTNGQYIVSEDAQELNTVFNKMLAEVKESEASSETAITLNIKKTNEEGAFDSFSQTILYPLSPIKQSDEIILQDSIRYEVLDGQMDEDMMATSFKQYDRFTSKYLSGDTVPAEETIITKRIPADVSRNSEALSIHVEEIIFLNKLTGLDAPRGQRFMGVLMSLTNVLPEQEYMVYPDGSGHPSSWVAGGNEGKLAKTRIPYSIPSFTSHFSMSFNNLGPYPASTATWLTYEPLAIPGIYDITLNPDDTKTGMMVFLVPDLPLEQLGIHFYDDNYGYIDIPVVGIVPKTETIYHPGTKAAAKLLDNFTLEVTGYGVEEILEEKIIDSQHRIVEGNFISDVKANLNVKPDEGMYLRFPTENGDFYTPLSKTTSTIASGFYSSRSVSPGSNNQIRMAFQMPKVLNENTAELFLDLNDEDVLVNVNEGTLIPADVKESFSTEFFDVDINDFVIHDEKIIGLNWSWAIADVTIHEKKDSFATRGIPDNFYITYIGDDSSQEENSKIESPGLGGFAASKTYGYDGASRIDRRLGNDLQSSDYTENLLFGFDDDTIFYDGTSRRGFILFSIGNDETEKEWTLNFDDTELNFPINLEPSIPLQQLLVEKEEYKVDTRYEENFKLVLQKAINEYKLRYPNIEKVKNVTDDIYDDVAMPSINGYGYQIASEINSVEELENTIRSLRFVTAGSKVDFRYMMSKEALLTQGFGTEGDMANFAIETLSRLGYKTKRKNVTLTEKGVSILEEMSGIENLIFGTLPAISYTDDNGHSKMMVLPFARDIKDLEGLAYYEAEDGGDCDSKPYGLSVFYNVIPTEKGYNAQINNMAGALGGASGVVEEMTENLQTFYIPLDTFSKDAVDVGTYIIGNKAYAVIYTAEGETMSEDYIDLNYYGIRGIGIELAGKTHYTKITEDMEANQVFMTVGFNLPELPLEAANLISEQMKFSQDLKADTMASLKWLHRKAIFKFIADQTTFERSLDESYGLVTGRVINPRLIVVQSVIDDKLTMSMDLLTIQNDLHTGEDDLQNSYRLMSGLSASQLESKALGNGMGINEIWEKMPEDANLVLFNSRNLEDYRVDMESSGVPQYMIDYFNSIDDMVLIQSKPSQIDGKERWAWIEIDKNDYSTISVIDTFEHGSMSSNATLNSAMEKAQYAIGAFKGVETSIWSVSAFSLELTDYDAILKSAQAFALGIGENFETNIGDIKLEAGKVPELTGVSKEIVDFFKPKGKDDDEEESAGFKEGYIKGVNMYFKLAQ